MQFYTIVSSLALLATGVLAVPAEQTFETFEVRVREAAVNCNQILPACYNGHVIGQTNCRCNGQHSNCDLWTCPGSQPNTVSLDLSASPYMVVSFVGY